jgi:hypothetical protein
MRDVIVYVVALLGAAPAGYCKPGDSVDSGRMRGDSSMMLGAESDLKFHPLYESVWLGSQTNADYFTDYGPFVNRSRAIVKVALAYDGAAGHDGLSASVDGAVVARDNRYIAFTVMPGQTYGFSVKDYANISAYATNPKLQPADVGLPSAYDFQYPSAKFYACYSDVASYVDDIGFVYSTYYTYVPGTFSDSSTRPSETLWNNLLLGPKPSFDVQCQKYGG